MKNPKPGKHLLIASTGGHLAQLLKWSEIVGSDLNSLWVTFDNNQSRSLLQGRRVIFVSYIAPRDFVATAKALIRLVKQVKWKEEKFVAAISTGAALALPGLLLSLVNRVQCFYFESVSRVNGPSLTGKILSRVPGIELSCQYKEWADSKWQYRGTLFDNYRRVPKEQVQHPSLFVSLGTISPYRFDQLVDRVLATGLADDRTVWQLGCTDREGLPGSVYEQVSSDEFDHYAASADVVITHSGVGTIMKLLDLGRSPIIVPRRHHRNEHVDDHQTQIAGMLEQIGIAQICEVSELTRDAVISSTEYETASVAGRQRARDV